MFIPKRACWLNLQEGWWRLFRKAAFAGQTFADADEIAHAVRRGHRPAQHPRQTLDLGTTGTTHPHPTPPVRVLPLRNDALAALTDRDQRRLAKQALNAMPPFRRVTGPATRKLVRATLRAALNNAITQEIITFNPAAHVEMDPAKRPKPMIWTPARVAKFQETGLRPSPVMVWTPEQTGEFLDFIADDDLYAYFHLIAFRGLRRGEAIGLRWEDVDFAALAVTIAVQIIDDGGELSESAPKSDAGERVIAIDAETAAVLKRHRARQNQQRLAMGKAWVDTGRVFTQPTGEWLHPARVSDRFDRLVKDSGLPPVRLHDLRHGAATLALAAGVDMKVIQETLGHSSIVLTSDTYSSVLPQVARAGRRGGSPPRATADGPSGHAMATQAEPDTRETMEEIADFEAYKQVRDQSSRWGGRGSNPRPRDYESPALTC